jgi:translation initiation factor 3 subunit F
LDARERSYVRRGEGVSRVIGAALGTRSVDGARCEIKSAYAIPCHERDGEMFVDIEFHRTMLGLHARVNEGERVVGWFSCGALEPAAKALAHEFFAKETAGGAPVHVMLDTEFTSASGDLLRAEVGETVLAVTDRESGESRSAGVRFCEASCDVDLTSATKIGIEALTQTASVKGDDDVVGLRATIGKLSGLLAHAQEYVDAVASGAKRGDAAVGRALSAALSNVPELTKAQIDKVFGDSMEDVQMVQYLTNLTKMQLTLAEKLHTTSLLV